jgi:hypothetical protein
MVASGLSLLLTLVIIFIVAWSICYILAKWAPDVPAQVQKVVWLIAAIVACIKLALWAGI